MATEEIDAAMVAEFDQAFAESEQFLSHLVATYRIARAADERNGYPECMSIVSLSQALCEDAPVEALSSALAVAIIAIARQMDAQG